MFNSIELSFVASALFAKLKLGSVLDAAKSSIFEYVACSDDVIESIDSLVFGMIETVFDCTLPVSVGVKFANVELSKATIKYMMILLLVCSTLQLLKSWRS